MSGGNLNKFHSLLRELETKENSNRKLNEISTSPIKRYSVFQSKPFSFHLNDNLEIIDENEEKFKKKRKSKIENKTNSNNKILDNIDIISKNNQTPKLIRHRMSILENEITLSTDTIEQIPKNPKLKTGQRRRSVEFTVFENKKKGKYSRLNSISSVNNCKKSNSINMMTNIQLLKSPTPNISKSKALSCNKSKNSQTQLNSLTVDKIVSDFNKNFISFGRRKTYKQKIMSTLMENNDKKLLNETFYSVNSYKKSNKDIKNNIRNSIKNKNNIKSPLWSRIRIIVNIIGTISFLRQEIILYGAKPKVYKRLIRNENNQIELIDNQDHLEDNIDLNHDQHKQNLPLSFSTKILPSSNSKLNIILLPESLFIRYWNYLIFLIYIYSLTVVPYRITFSDNYFNTNNKIWFFNDILYLLIFTLYIIFNFITGFYNIQGIIELQPRKIIKRYLEGWFLFDLLCLFPYSLYIKSTSSSLLINVYGSHIGLSWIETIPFLRLIRFSHLLSNVKVVDNVSLVLKMSGGKFKVLLFFIESTIICHLFACLWYFSARIDNFSEDTWVSRGNWLDQETYLLYIKSLYFTYVVFITVGYGDISAYSNTEITICTLFMSFTALYYTYYITLLSNIFMNMQMKRLLYNDKSLMISDICKSAKISVKLEESIIKYIKQIYKNDNGNYSDQDLKHVLSELSSSLRLNIGMTIYNGFYKKIRILENASKAFISNIIILMKMEIFEENQNVYLCDDVPEKMYFILKGRTIMKNEDDIAFASLSNGTYFGEIEIIRKTYREYTIKADSLCELITLKKSIIYDEINQNHSEFFNILLDNMMKRHTYNEKAKQKIEKIINKGKEVICDNEKVQLIRSKIINMEGYNGYNYRKKYFFIGLQNYIEESKHEVDMNEMSLNSNLEILNKEVNIRKDVLRTLNKEKSYQSNVSIKTEKNIKVNRYKEYIKNLSKYKKKEDSNKKNSSTFLSGILNKIEKPNLLQQKEVDSINSSSSSSKSNLIYNQVEIQMNNMIKELKAIKIQNIDIQKCVVTLISTLNKKKYSNSGNSIDSNTESFEKINIQRRNKKERLSLENKYSKFKSSYELDFTSNLFK